MYNLLSLPIYNNPHTFFVCAFITWRRYTLFCKLTLLLMRLVLFLGQMADRAWNITAYTTFSSLLYRPMICMSTYSYVCTYYLYVCAECSIVNGPNSKHNFSTSGMGIFPCFVGVNTRKQEKGHIYDLIFCQQLLLDLPCTTDNHHHACLQANMYAYLYVLLLHKHLGCCSTLVFMFFLMLICCFLLCSVRCGIS